MFLLKLKKGFTLAETLIVLLIISILIVATITVMKPNDKVLKYQYSNAYTGISEGFYNVLLYKYDSDLFPDESGPEKLCQELTDYINTLSENCSDSKDVGLGTDIFEDEKIQFVSTNGMRFYFSNMQTISYKLNNEDHSLKYYMAYVDINGKKGPNRLGVDSNKRNSAPDIFAFALLETGKTVPLGLPEIDDRFMQARLAYYDNHAEIQYAEPSLPYYLAKNAAWGCYDKVDQLTTEEKSNKLLFNEPEEPHTMNDVIRNSLPANSKIRIDIPDVSNSLKGNDTKYRCTRYDFENCFVVIDSYN